MSGYDHLIERLRIAEGYNFDLFREVIDDLRIPDISKFRVKSVLDRVARRPTTDTLDELDNFMVELAQEVLHITPGLGLTVRHVDQSAIPSWAGGKHAIVTLGREDEELRAAAATITAAALILMSDVFLKVEANRYL